MRNQIRVQKALLGFENCLCDRRNKGKGKLAAENEKRRAYYKTREGIATKKEFREKAAVKKQISNHLSMINVSTKANLCEETIANLLKLL